MEKNKYIPSEGPSYDVVDCPVKLKEIYNAVGVPMPKDLVAVLTHPGSSLDVVAELRDHPSHPSGMMWYRIDRDADINVLALPVGDDWYYRGYKVYGPDEDEDMLDARIDAFDKALAEYDWEKLAGVKLATPDDFEPNFSNDGDIFDQDVLVTDALSTSPDDTRPLLFRVIFAPYRAAIESITTNPLKQQ